jgi:hypothetical protein
MTMINPVTQEAYVHFGEVPSGGRPIERGK